MDTIGGVLVVLLLWVFISPATMGSTWAKIEKGYHAEYNAPLENDK
jgi:hypothetical protein